jgi:type III secretion system low calcium response chaperone LcrH/SycD
MEHIFNELDAVQQQLASVGGIPEKHLTAGSLSFSEDARKGLYATAFHLYQNGKYQEAVDCFRILVLIDAPERNHWMGYAATLQMLKRYEEALYAYSVAAIMKPEDPHAHIYAANCCFSSEQIERGLQALDSADDAINGQEEYNHLITHVSLLRQAWTNRQ